VRLRPKKKVSKLIDDAFAHIPREQKIPKKIQSRVEGLKKLHFKFHEM